MKSDLINNQNFAKPGKFPEAAEQAVANDDNKRRLHRHNLQVTADVYDRTSQRFLGRLVNLHTEGLMIFGNYALKADHIYQLDLHLTTPINDRNMLPLGVECLWTRDQAEDRIHWAGCRIIDISDDALADLEELIQKYGEM